MDPLLRSAPTTFTNVLFLLGSFLWIACADENKGAYRVKGLENFSPEHRATILSSIARVNEVTGSEIFSADGGGTPVTLKTETLSGALLGHTVSNRNSAEVTLSPLLLGELPALKLVLAHELGHVVGLQHDSNPEAIMYVHMNLVSQDSPEGWRAFGDKLKYAVRVR